ncbi:MAG: hypothetical protein CMB99_01430 [Flavobacteriaceae bacterium]|nr:hypothetical protein [Flavobacteriaceae bacterium]
MPLRLDAGGQTTDVDVDEVLERHHHLKRPVQHLHPANAGIDGGERDLRERRQLLPLHHLRLHGEHVRLGGVGQEAVEVDDRLARTGAGDPEDQPGGGRSTAGSGPVDLVVRGVRAVVGDHEPHVVPGDHGDRGRGGGGGLAVPTAGDDLVDVGAVVGGDPVGRVGASVDRRGRSGDGRSGGTGPGLADASDGGDLAVLEEDVRLKVDVAERRHDGLDVDAGLAARRRRKVVALLGVHDLAQVLAHAGVHPQRVGRPVVGLSDEALGAVGDVVLAERVAPAVDDVHGVFPAGKLTVVESGGAERVDEELLQPVELHGHHVLVAPEQATLKLAQQEQGSVDDLAGDGVAVRSLEERHDVGHSPSRPHELDLRVLPAVGRVVFFREVPLGDVDRVARPVFFQPVEFLDRVEGCVLVQRLPEANVLRLVRHIEQAGIE